MGVLAALNRRSDVGRSNLPDNRSRPRLLCQVTTRLSASSLVILTQNCYSMLIRVTANTLEAVQGLREVRYRANDLRSVFEGYSKFRRSRYALQFALGIDPYGKPWLPLTETTIRLKRKRGQPAKPLVATGKLSRSQVCFPSRMSYHEWINDPKAAKLHQKRPLLPDPARGLPKSDLVALTTLLQRHFEA